MVPFFSKIKIAYKHIETVLPPVLKILLFENISIARKQIQIVILRMYLMAAYQYGQDKYIIEKHCAAQKRIIHNITMTKI